ncbi:hypothetical protein KIN20_031463 [Parelaphostrongylus tenuis]|uniref:Uncharacterized protein n=1 Tax=Parelaphostrongylus tenuis TaxID=148309 RepID=A0AAD5WHM8_PARTN|nr:hypothetical protein KIN20_031463 [Parelaphostrongylus tenuis]
MENMVFDARASECASLENLLNGNVARGSSARGFSFVFPSFAVLALCRNKIHKEISYCNDYLEFPILRSGYVNDIVFRIGVLRLSSFIAHIAINSSLCSIAISWDSCEDPNAQQPHESQKAD